MTNSLFAPPALGTVLSLTGLPGGGSKIQDRSAYGNHGTIVGATWKRTPGELWVLSFDGVDDFVDVSPYPSIPTDGSVEVWFRGVPGGNPLVSWRDATGKTISLAPEATFLNVSFYDGAQYLTKKKNVPLSSSLWYHGVVTWTANGQTLKVYVNADSTAQGTGYAQGAGTGLNLGRRVGGIVFFQGLIGIVRLSNHARSALQIQNDFQQEKLFFGVWSF